MLSHQKAKSQDFWSKFEAASAKMEARGNRNKQDWTNKRPLTRLAYRRDEAAAALGVSVTKFADWERRGMVPKPVKIDGVTLYDATQLSLAWEAMRDGTSAEFDTGNPYDAE